ncbi:MAG: endonuclease III domain-containing protein [Gammaproteobacteria bacterium]
MSKPLFESVYDTLRTHHGRQRWWPAESAFEMMVGAVLTQNTAWTNVERAIDNLEQAAMLAPRPILNCDRPRLAELLRPSGYFNVKARRLRALCQWYVDEGGMECLKRRQTRALRESLLAVNGIGPETADDILLYAFKRPVFVIDAYTRRMFSRLGLIDAEAPYEELRAQFEAGLPPGARLFNEYHALIVTHGKHICQARPKCGDCVLAAQCAYVHS